jgi:hypothetical protein
MLTVNIVISRFRCEDADAAAVCVVAVHQTMQQFSLEGNASKWKTDEGLPI